MHTNSLPQPQPWSPRSRQSLWWLLLLAFPLLAGFGAPRVVDSAYAPAQQIKVGATAAWQMPDPVVDARAYLLYNVDTEALLLAENADVALPPASLTKLMTALLVLEADDLQREIMVEREDLVGGASMGLVAGEVITIEKLLWGLLIPSGNDAAMTLARATSGSVAAFVERMNQRAAGLALAQTHFVNPHGLDAEGHVSSAADMLTLVRAIWDFPLFREIVGTAEATVNGHLLINTNELLNTYTGTIGVKTGTTDAAGQCLIAAFQQDGHQVVGIVLGSADRYSDMRALHRYFQNAYEWLHGDASALSILNQLYAPNGQRWYLRAAGAPPTIFVNAVEQDQLFPFRRLTLPTDQPWRAGTEVGVIEWRLHNRRVIDVQPLVLW